VDLRPTDDQNALRAEAAAFCEGLRPLLESDPDWWRQGMLSDGDSREVNRALGSAGWIGMSWPVAFGGRGLSRLTATLVEEVFGYHWLPLSSYLLSFKTIGAAIERFGSPELVALLLPQIACGELVFCQGFSEPGAGSDLGALTTRAERRGDVYVVNGHKIWTSSAHLADWIYLAVRTDSEASKHRGISLLVAPIETPGIDVRTFPTLGGGYLCETFLDDVEIPAENLVGELNGGWSVLMVTLDFERITAEKLGGVAWVLDAVEGRLRETDRLDRAAGERLAQLRGELGAARLLSFRAADVLDRGLPGSATSAMAKLAGARLAQRAGDAAVDLLGLEGLGDASADAAIQGRAAALYRASVGSTIAGGTAEVQQLVIARRGLGLG
jgi:alkylation response protein AidB-like acyl-CoA dehydrogenase